MAKYWTTGQVKTRLGQSIGQPQAAAVHRQFVIHVARSLQSVADRRIFAVAPAEQISEFRAALPPGFWEIRSQGPGDLGRRIEAWFRETLASTAASRPNASVLIGADCPTLSEREIENAFDQLISDDVVLGPARDGGYYLIGLRSPWRDEYQRLFADIPWSSDRVYQATAERIEQLGLRLASLAIREDVDTIDELNRLRVELAKSSQRDHGCRDLASAIESILGESAT